MAKVLGVDVGAVRDKVGGRKAGDRSGGSGNGGLGGAVGDLGAFLRDQREQAQMSLRQLADAAGVSNPYLSQVERGLRRPSAEVLQQIARGLRISAEALYVRAGILEERPGADGEVREALLSDPFLSERQRQVVLEIYCTFRAENARSEVPTASTPTDPPADPPAADGDPADEAPAAPRRRRRRPAATAQGRGRADPAEEGEGSGTEEAAPAARTTARSRRRRPADPPSPRDVAEEAGLTVPQEPSPQESAASHPADGATSDDPPTT